MIPLSAALEAAAPGWYCTAFKNGVMLTDSDGLGWRLSEVEARALLRALPVDPAEVAGLVEVFACAFSR